MKKFLFSCFTILLMSGFVGGLDANAVCTDHGTGLGCSGGTFYGTGDEIACWMRRLIEGICAGSPAGTEWIFHDVNGGTSTFEYTDVTPE